MDDPVRRAIALLNGMAKWGAREYPGSARMHDRELLGRDDVGLQSRRKTERNEYSRRVRRQLNTRATFIRPSRVLANRRAESLLSKRKGCRHSADPCPSDDYSARGNHDESRLRCSAERLVSQGAFGGARRARVQARIIAE